MEIGPYRVKDGSRGPVLEYNPGSWDEFANIMFVDNPVGTGYSFVDTDSYLHELPEMASQFISFLDKFFALFPEYEHDDVGLDKYSTWFSLIFYSFTSQGNLTLANISPT
jgi:carboxypeptidase D